MSSEEFWKDDPQLFISYRTSFINKRKKEIDDIDYKCWLQGVYIMESVGRLVASLKQMIGNMFSSTKDRTKIDEYPKQPLSILQEEQVKKDKEMERKNKYDKFEKDIIYFGTLKQQYINKLKKDKEKGGVKK